MLHPTRCWSFWRWWLRPITCRVEEREYTFPESEVYRIRESQSTVQIGPWPCIKARTITSTRIGLELDVSHWDREVILLDTPGKAGRYTVIESTAAGRMVGTPPRSPSLGPLAPDSIPTTPGKEKVERLFFPRSPRLPAVPYRTLAWIGIALLALGAILYIGSSGERHNASLLRFDILQARQVVPTWGGEEWERKVRLSAKPKRPDHPVVLVTGAAGFVGSHLALALKKRGDGVVGLDNFNAYYDPKLKRDREENLKNHNVFVVEGDINDGALLAKLFELVRFTHVAHMAAQAGVRYALENPASYIQSNVAGWVSVLEACKRADPQPAVVWASSSSVYGLNAKIPFSESDQTDQPASLYAATKKAGEEIAHSYNHIYGLSLTALRFFTVYGPWGRPDMAYFSFTRNILEGKPIKVYQGANKTDLARDFTYIDDIIKGCIAALDTAEPSTGSGGRKRGPAQLRTYNLGNTQPVSVPVLVTLLEKQLKVKAKKVTVKMPRNGDVPFTHANVTKAHIELAYNPTTDLKTGVKQFVKWYVSYHGIADTRLQQAGERRRSSRRDMQSGSLARVSR